MCGAKFFKYEEGERRQLDSGQSGSHLDSNVLRKLVKAFHRTKNHSYYQPVSDSKQEGMFIFIFRATFTVQLWPNRLRPQTCSALLQYTLICII